MPKDRKITRANKKAFRGKQHCLVGLSNSQPRRRMPSPSSNVKGSAFEIEDIYLSAFETNHRKH